MRRYVGILLAMALVTAGPPRVWAKDEAKAACKQGCQVTLQTCKQGCQVERDSGTQEESDLYRQCDQGCHDDYAGCKNDCESQ